MGATYKNNIELTIFGESHGKAIGITIGNLPSGIQIDLDEVSRDMKRRAPGQNKMSTARKEADQVEILSGLQDGITTGAPLTGVIYNSDQHSKDYSLLKTNMRPGHSDYPAYIKYKGFNDVRGGGHFSGRITAPIVFAGNIAKQILKQKGIKIAVVTNKPHKSAVKMVETLFGKDYFDLITGSKDDTPRKPNPATTKQTLQKLGCKAGEAIFFGDSDVDIETAKNADIEAIACSWGFRSFESLLAKSPSAIIDEPKYISKLF